MRLADGTATTGEKLSNIGDRFHNSLWNYDKGLRVAMAQDLQKQGMDWPEIAQRVNQAYGKPLDPTTGNMWLKRFSFTPSWTANNLAWDARNLLNPRVRALTTALDSVNRANSGHGRGDNIPGKQEYTAVGRPGADQKQPFINFSTPDKDLRELARNPLDYLVQRMAPLPHLGAEFFKGNSRPGDTQLGLDYTKAGAGGPLIGYGPGGYGPDVSLHTQALMRLVPPLFGQFGSVAGDTLSAGRSANPLRDLALRLGGMYASDVNEPLSKALDFRQQVKDQKAAQKAITRRAFKRNGGQ